MRVRAKSAFKSFYFFVTKKKHKKADTVCIKYYLTRNTNAQHQRTLILLPNLFHRKSQPKVMNNNKVVKKQYKFPN